MESQDLDKLFRDAFEHAEETPNKRVWNEIEQKLNQEKKIVPFYSKYKTQLSIAASLLLFFGIGLTFYKKPISVHNQSAEKVLMTNKKENEVINNTPNYDKVENSTENKQGAKVSSQFKNENLANTNISDAVQTYKQETNMSSQSQIDQVDSNEHQLIESDVMLTVVHVDINTTPNHTVEVKALETIVDDIQLSQAYNIHKEESKPSLVTRVLNGISKNIISKSFDGKDNKEIEFKNDDEGSITINFANTFIRK